MIIGIDIGGTNTDCVLIDCDGKILSKVKINTSDALHESVVACIKKVSPAKLTRIAIGTTFATNAILEAKELLSVGVIRIAGQRPAIAPGFDFPENLQIIRRCVTIDGGFRCDASPLTPFCKKQAQAAVDELVDIGVEAIAITGAYSPLNPIEEQIVAEMVPKDIYTSISSDIGGIGFLQRESSTILNASLKKAIFNGFTQMEDAIRKLGIDCPIFMVKNDGSVMDLSDAIENPILTIAAGQTNSFFGAAALANIKDAIVVDIGGTSTDIGLVLDGIPKRSCQEASIGDVLVQFAMPDAISLAIGGGSIITDQIGPESVGKKLTQKALCFGGDTLTLTDVAIKAGRMRLANDILLDFARAQKIMAEVDERIARGIALMRCKHKDLPVIICGGGARIGYKEGMLMPEDAGLANAYGAAQAGVCYTLDKAVSLLDRERMLANLKEEALEKAIEKGANPLSTKISNIEISPYAYSKEALSRVIISATGNFKTT